MSRDEFLTRVRQAASAGRAYRVHTRSDLPANVGYQGAGADVVVRMVAEVNLVGGHAHQVADLAAAQSVLKDLLNEYRPRTALCCWRHPLLDRLELPRLLAESRTDLLDIEILSTLDLPSQRERMLHADIGITSATVAIAETGTLAMASAPGSERAASLLPPVHVAVIERSQIVPDLFDFFAQWQAAGTDQLASNLTLITGPSKTGDLELRLTTGVHGPGKWHVIVIDDQKCRE